MPGWWTPERQREAYEFLIFNGGLSPYGAAALVSRWANVESTAAGPSAVNPYSGAFGIAQWLGSRKPAIAGNTNFQAQLAYAVRELNSTEARAGAVLRSAQTAQEGARGASMYERAEGYNAATGIDNWTARTTAGVAGVLAAAGGGGLPATIATGIEPREYLERAPLSQAGITAGPALFLVAGGLLLWYVMSD